MKSGREAAGRCCSRSASATRSARCGQLGRVCPASSPGSRRATGSPRGARRVAASSRRHASRADIPVRSQSGEAPTRASRCSRRAGASSREHLVPHIVQADQARSAHAVVDIALDCLAHAAALLVESVGLRVDAVTERAGRIPAIHFVLADREDDFRPGPRLFRSVFLRPASSTGFGAAGRLRLASAPMSRTSSSCTRTRSTGHRPSGTACWCTCRTRPVRTGTCSAKCWAGAGVERVQAHFDIDSTSRAAFLCGFLDTGQAGRTHSFYVKYSEHFTIGQRRRIVAGSRARRNARRSRPTSGATSTSS